jgi:hypothetical protein
MALSPHQQYRMHTKSVQNLKTTGQTECYINRPLITDQPDTGLWRSKYVETRNPVTKWTKQKANIEN